MNKRQERIYKLWQISTDTNLYDIYKSFSVQKHNAYMKCRNDCTSKGGSYFSIITHNQMMFTCGYTYWKDNQLYFVYFTKTKREEWRVC